MSHLLWDSSFKLMAAWLQNVQKIKTIKEFSLNIYKHGMVTSNFRGQVRLDNLYTIGWQFCARLSLIRTGKSNYQWFVPEIAYTNCLHFCNRKFILLLMDGYHSMLKNSKGVLLSKLVTIVRQFVGHVLRTLSSTWTHSVRFTPHPHASAPALPYKNYNGKLLNRMDNMD